jgi:hypothetical protein
VPLWLLVPSLCAAHVVQSNIKRKFAAAGENLLVIVPERHLCGTVGLSRRSVFADVQKRSGAGQFVIYEGALDVKGAGRFFPARLRPVGAGLFVLGRAEVGRSRPAVGRP